jgi:hypothetical protein
MSPLAGARNLTRLAIAAVHAVLDALTPFGIAHLDMPLTSDKIWAALEDARKP